MKTPASTITASVLTVAALVTLLVVGKPLLLPLAVAIMVWYIIDAMANSFGRVEIAGIKPFARFRLLLALATIVLLIFGVANMVGDTVEQVRQAAPGYKGNVLKIVEKASTLTGIEVAPAVQNFAAQIDIGSAVSKIAGGMLSLAGDAGMVAIYVLFILIEQRFFDAKLSALFADGESESRVRGIIEHIQAQIRQYLYLKTLVSAATGLLSYAILLWVGVDYAAFWAFLIFLFNFIPTIGSLLGVAFPVVLALVQFDTLTPFLILLAALGAVQFTIGNLLEPRLMGSSLNLSPLVVILALSLWGQLWGIVGMFLSVPLTVILMIIFSNFTATRRVALALSRDGRLQQV
jgi:predicted PurR-regulated permease PerM